MDRASDQLFPRSGLAEDADRDVARGDALDEREDRAHERRLSDHSFNALVARRCGRFFLLQDSAQAVILGARPEQSGNRLARCFRPGAGAFDEQELAIAAPQPVGFERVRDFVERCRIERSGAVLRPLAQPIPGCVTPRPRKCLGAERVIGGRGRPQHLEVGCASCRGCFRNRDRQLAGKLTGDALTRQAECASEQLQLLRSRRRVRRNARRRRFPCRERGHEAARKRLRPQPAAHPHQAMTIVELAVVRVTGRTKRSLPVLDPVDLVDDERRGFADLREEIVSIEKRNGEPARVGVTAARELQVAGEQIDLREPRLVVRRRVVLAQPADVLRRWTASGRRRSPRTSA